MEIKNSMRQALQQQGFFYQQTQSQTNTPDIAVSHGKTESKFGGGRWLDSERAALGMTLQMHGIEWENQNIRRDHLTVKEYNACAEIINKEVDKIQATELIMREPNLSMKLAGIKEDEIIVLRSSVETLQKENSFLRVQTEIDRTTIEKMDKEKESRDGFIQRTLKEADNKERQANTLKIHYSQGTAIKFKELAGKYKQLLELCQKLKLRCETVESEKKKIEDNNSDTLKKAVSDATQTLQDENLRLYYEINELKNEIDQWKQKIGNLQQKVDNISRFLHDVIRAIFTLKYGWKDKRQNPYKSGLTEDASHLIDSMERKSRIALLDAGHSELEKSLNSMGVNKEFENDIRNHILNHSAKSYSIGD